MSANNWVMDCSVCSRASNSRRSRRTGRCASKRDCSSLGNPPASAAAIRSTNQSCSFMTNPRRRGGLVRASLNCAAKLRRFFCFGHFRTFSDTNPRCPRLRRRILVARSSSQRLLLSRASCAKTREAGPLSKVLKAQRRLPGEAASKKLRAAGISDFSGARGKLEIRNTKIETNQNEENQNEEKKKQISNDAV